ncbi:MAG: hypothetical protein K2X91_05775, partial [Thermoleophilia bacterium]|nr:hypothetical protein [Thermoleophilia bacterium]
MSAPEWRCFHCGEVFTDRRCAALHFGADEGCKPACQIKGAEGGLLKALRETEEALFKATCALHDENAEALRSWREVGSRHAGALIAAEQVGYDRGLADMRHQVEVLSRALCWHGDRARMATTREE